MPQLRYYTEDQVDEAIQFKNPDINNFENMSKRHIVASTNELCDFWNTKIQSFNHERPHSLLSVDTLCDCDDPYGILKSMLTSDLLNRYNHSGVPPYNLILKEGDICIVLRKLVAKKLPNNSIVKVIKITQFSITEQTIGCNPIRIIIPRICFKFKLPYGNSYSMLRKQFPLRLAYAMTLNKVQGQEADSLLFDTRNAPFAMSHTYVGFSRVRKALSIAIFCNRKDILHDAPTITNIIYPELLRGIETSYLHTPDVYDDDLMTDEEKEQTLNH